MNGFIGTHIRTLADSYGIGYHGFSRSKPAVENGEPSKHLVNADAVIWAASMITPAVAEEHPEATEAEQRTFREVVDAMRNSEHPQHLVLMSSGGTVYGGDAAPYTEADEPKPVNKYGESKLALEHIAGESGVPTTVLRVANAYGPGQKAARGQGVIGHWMRALREGRPITIFGDGTDIRDYVYVADIADAVLKAATTTPADPFQIANIGSGEPTSLTQLAELCLAAAQSDGDIQYRPHRGFDTAANWLDVGAAAELLDWQPTTSLPAGLKQTWNWLQSTG